MDTRDLNFQEQPSWTSLTPTCTVVSAKTETKKLLCEFSNNFKKMDYMHVGSGTSCTNEGYGP